MNTKKIIATLALAAPLALAPIVTAEAIEAPNTQINELPWLTDQSVQEKYINYYNSIEEKPAIMWYDPSDTLCANESLEEINFLDVQYLEDYPADFQEGVFIDYLIPKEDNPNEQALNRLQHLDNAAWEDKLFTIGDRVPAEELPYEVFGGRKNPDKSFILLEKSANGGVISETEAKEALTPIKELYKSKICFDNGGYMSMLYTTPKIIAGMTPSLTYDELWTFATVKDGKPVLPEHIFTKTSDVNAYLRGMAFKNDVAHILRDGYNAKDSSVLMAQDGVYIMAGHNNGPSTHNYISVRIPKEFLKPEIAQLYQEKVAAKDLPTPSISLNYEPTYLGKKPNEEALEALEIPGKRIYAAVGQPTKMYAYNGNNIYDNGGSPFERNGVENKHFLWVPSVLAETGLHAVDNITMNYLAPINENSDNLNYQAIEQFTKKNSDVANEQVLTMDEAPTTYEFLADEKTLVATFKDGDQAVEKVLFTSKGDGSVPRNQIIEKVSEAKEQYTPIISYDNHGYTSIVSSGPNYVIRDFDVRYDSSWNGKTFKDGKPAPLSAVVEDIYGLELYLIGLAQQEDYQREQYLDSQYSADNENWFITEEGIFLRIGDHRNKWKETPYMIRIPDVFLTEEIKAQYPEPIASGFNIKKVIPEDFFQIHKKSITLTIVAIIGGIIFYITDKKKRNQDTTEVETPEETEVEIQEEIEVEIQEEIEVESQNETEVETQDKTTTEETSETETEEPTEEPTTEK